MKNNVLFKNIFMMPYLIVLIFLLLLIYWFMQDDAINVSRLQRHYTTLENLPPDVKSLFANYKIKMYNSERGYETDYWTQFDITPKGAGDVYSFDKSISVTYIRPSTRFGDNYFILIIGEKKFKINIRKINFPCVVSNSTLFFAKDVRMFFSKKSHQYEYVVIKLL